MSDYLTANPVPRIAIIMAVHNRVEVTLRCLRQIADSTLAVPNANIFIVDDGSKDGTTASVLQEFPGTNVLKGDGSLFWGRAMAIAEKAAIAQGVDFLLWLNDDIEIYPHAIEHLLASCPSPAQGPRPIITGALQYPNALATSYSGYRRKRPTFGLLRLSRIDPHGTEPQEVDTFNGNIVLVPVEHSVHLGGIDDAFTHHYGDLDFGLRASKAGIPSMLACGYVGATARNSAAGTFRDNKVSRLRRVEDLFGPKGFPPVEKFRYLRRHGGLLWPLQWAGFYGYWSLRIVTKL